MSDVWPEGYERTETRGMDFGTAYRVGRVRKDDAWYVIEDDSGVVARVRASETVRRKIAGLPRNPSPWT